MLRYTQYANNGAMLRRNELPINALTMQFLMSVLQPDPAQPRPIKTVERIVDHIQNTQSISGDVLYSYSHGTARAWPRLARNLWVAITTIWLVIVLWIVGLRWMWHHWRRKARQPWEPAADQSHDAANAL
jgi:hypothetical protein